MGQTCTGLTSLRVVKTKTYRICNSRFALVFEQLRISSGDFVTYVLIESILNFLIMLPTC